MFKEIKDAPNFEYRGEIYKYASKGINRYLATLENTVNKNILLVNVYLNGKRVSGTRINKDKLTYFEINDILMRAYWEFVYGK